MQMAYRSSPPPGPSVILGTRAAPRLHSRSGLRLFTALQLCRSQKCSNLATCCWLGIFSQRLDSVQQWLCAVPADGHIRQLEVHKQGRTKALPGVGGLLRTLLGALNPPLGDEVLCSLSCQEQTDVLQAQQLTCSLPSRTAALCSGCAAAPRR